MDKQVRFNIGYVIIAILAIVLIKRALELLTRHRETLESAAARLLERESGLPKAA